MLALLWAKVCSGFQEAKLLTIFSVAASGPMHAGIRSSLR